MDYRRWDRRAFGFHAWDLAAATSAASDRRRLLRHGETEAQAFDLMIGDRRGDQLLRHRERLRRRTQRNLHRRWLKAKGPAVRQQLLLSSKVFNRWDQAPTIEDSHDANLQQVDESLARLQTDRLDMYLIHEPDLETPLDETFRRWTMWCPRARCSTSARAISSMGLARALWISDKKRLRRFDWVQNSFSLLDRSEEREMFPLCADQGVGFTAFSPLAGGWLTGKYREAAAYPDGSRMTLRPEPYRHLERDNVFRGLAALAEEARARGVEMSALAIAWVLHHPRVDAAIIGPRNAAHFDAALASTTIDSPRRRRRLAALFERAALIR